MEPRTEAGRYFYFGNAIKGYEAKLARDIAAIESEARAAALREVAEPLRALSDAATPGPWVDQVPGDNDPGAGTVWIDTHAYPEGPEPVIAPSYPLSQADAAFIAVAVNRIRAILTEATDTSATRAVGASEQ